MRPALQERIVFYAPSLNMSRSDLEVSHVKKVGVGVLGLGFMATRVHLPALRKIEEAELVAVSSRSPEKAKEFGEKYGAKAYYTDYREMLRDPEVDVVFLCLPPSLVASVGLEVAGAGKNAILECPIAETLEQVDRLIEAERRAGVRLMPGQCLRFTPSFVKARELVEGGEIGAPVMIYFVEFVPAASLALQWEPGSWIWNKERGGPVPTMTVFSLDLVRWLLASEPVSIYAAIWFLDLPQFGGTLGYNVGIITKFKSGAIVINQNSGSVATSLEKVRLEIVGERGNAVVAEGGTTAILYGEKEEKQRWTFPVKGTEMWGHRQQDRHFIQSIAEGRKPAVTLQDARKALEMTLAALESDKTGRSVKL